MHIQDGKIQCLFQKSSDHYIMCEKEPSYYYILTNDNLKLNVGHFSAYCKHCHAPFATFQKYLVSKEVFVNKLKHLIFI